MRGAWIPPRLAPLVAGAVLLTAAGGLLSAHAIFRAGTASERQATLASAVAASGAAQPDLLARASERLGSGAVRRARTRAALGALAGATDRQKAERLALEAARLETVAASAPAPEAARAWALVAVIRLLQSSNGERSSAAVAAALRRVIALDPRDGAAKANLELVLRTASRRDERPPGDQTGRQAPRPSKTSSLGPATGAPGRGKEGY